MSKEIDSLSSEGLRQVGAQGKLSWKGKKVVLDPFIKVQHRVVVDEGYTIRSKLMICGREEEIGAEDVLFATGILQGQIFRFWEEEGTQKVDRQYLTLQELKTFVHASEKKGVALLWKCPIPRWKPEPLPILQLTDRTGAFANLWMDYGLFGREPVARNNPEELFWEKDLLETDFIRQQVGASNYYCPMDKVVKSLMFLLDLGWTLLDHRGKKNYPPGGGRVDGKGSS